MFGIAGSYLLDCCRFSFLPYITPRANERIYNYIFFTVLIQNFECSKCQMYKNFTLLITLLIITLVQI